MLRKFKIIYHPSNLKFIKKKFNIFYRIAMCLKHRAIIVLDEDAHTSKEKCTIKAKRHYEPAYSKMKKRASLGNKTSVIGNKTSVIRSTEMFDKKPSEIKTNKLAADNLKVDKVPKVLDSAELDELPKVVNSGKFDELPKFEVFGNMEDYEKIIESELFNEDDVRIYENKDKIRKRESRFADLNIDTEILELEQKLGNIDSEIVLSELNKKIKILNHLKEEIVERPSIDMQNTFDELHSEINILRIRIRELKNDNTSLRASVIDQQMLEKEIEELKMKNASFDKQIKSLESEIEEFMVENTSLYDQKKSLELEIEELKIINTSLDEQKNSLELDNNKLIDELSRFENATLDDKNVQKKSLELDNNRLIAELSRFENATEGNAYREERIRDIETLDENEKILPRLSQQNINEIKWLNHISQQCKEYGFKFPERLLCAFHTALKTSELSSLTVLAGLSGTGKSELPRLYSHFGGINFLNLSVQSNWDCQESMLGFFNSIDNKFDAQPVLKLLARTQKEKTKDYPYGLNDVLSLVLLDEMNLAHIELYFSEFLSKLELRRGTKIEDVPNIDVKLGAGILPYQLPLGRNVLWAGTMNQDETTKSLSDKVLDRSIIINFPRPTKLERRSELRQLNDRTRLISRKIWENWCCVKSSFTEKQIKPFKEFVEEMNINLANAGRAFGHRVWQSIEYYMSNYPEVIQALKTNDEAALQKAMKIAFEDQLVQKVMPKLRGIETRGTARSKCLDKIKAQLVDNEYGIIEDFDSACEFGYGVFIWQSANYLKDDEKEVIEQKPDVPKIETTKDSEEKLAQKQQKNDKSPEKEEKSDTSK